MTTTPRGLKARGRRLWVDVTSSHSPDQSASAVLAEACYTADLLTELRAKLATTPAIINGTQGERVHPLYVELRQQQLVFAKLIQNLGLPKEIAATLDVAADGEDEY